MEEFLLETLKTFKPSTITMSQLGSNLSEESDQDYSTTATHLLIIIQFILTKEMISPFLTKMWYHTDG